MNVSLRIPICVTAVLICIAFQHASAQTTLPRPTAVPATACIFSRDGSELFVATHNTILVLSTRDGVERHVLDPGLQRITSLNLSPDGRLLLAGGGVPGVSGTASIIERASGRTLAGAGDFKDLVTSVAFSPDGKYIAAASADRTATILALKVDPTNLSPVARLEGHAGPILSILFNRDGKLVITGSADRSIKVWGLPDGKLRRTLSNHTGAVFSLAGCPALPAETPFTCASAGDDRTVRVWQPEIGRMVRIVRAHQGPVFCVAYAPDGSALFSAGAEGIVRMIDAGSDTVLTEWKASDDWIYALAVSPDGTALATADWAGVIKLWRLGKDLKTLKWRYPPA
jgi:WD40 repeat protein